MRSRLLILLALGLLAGPQAARAATVALELPAELRAGESVTIRWHGLRPEAHEVELEVSLAGGRWVRISPELSALTGAYEWQVPRGSAGAARVRLRVGEGVRERIGAECAVRIVEPPTTAHRASPESAEWWNLARTTAPWRARMACAHAELAPRVPTLATVPSSPAPAPAPNVAERLAVGRAATFAAPERAPLGFVAPRLSPLRN